MACRRGGFLLVIKMSDERRNADRPNDWLFDTLSRMEGAEQRHSVEVRKQIAEVLKKLEEHITDDVNVQGAIRLDLRSLMDARVFEEKQRSVRLTIIIALSSIAGAIMLRLVDHLFKP